MNGADLRQLRDRFLAAQLRGDRRGALKVMIEEGLDAGASVNELREEVLRPAQLEIGRLWEENQVSVAEEHMATGITQLVLAQLFERSVPAPRLGKSVIAACVEGELHDLPGRLASDALELAGFSVRYLGTHLPTNALLEMLRADPPDLVTLSITMSFHVAALADAVSRIRAEHGPAVQIAIGGSASALADAKRAGVDADYFGTTAGGLVEAAKRLCAVPVPHDEEKA